MRRGGKRRRRPGAPAAAVQQAAMQEPARIWAVVQSAWRKECKDMCALRAFILGTERSGWPRFLSRSHSEVVFKASPFLAERLGEDERGALSHTWDTLSRSSGTTTADSYSGEGMPSESRCPPNSKRLWPSRSFSIGSSGSFFRGGSGASGAPPAGAAWLQSANGFGLGWAFSSSATAATSGYGRVSPAATTGHHGHRWLGGLGSVAGGSTGHSITVRADGNLGC
jgi:hypothetical protein